jgi:hypothetical protein
MKKILVFLFLVVFFTNTSSVFADNSRLYVVPETNFGTPNLPELYANEGKTFRREGVTITVVPNTIPYDVYLTTAVAEKLGRPIRHSPRALHPPSGSDRRAAVGLSW